MKKIIYKLGFRQCFMCKKIRYKIFLIKARNNPDVYYCRDCEIYLRGE